MSRAVTHMALIVAISSCILGCKPDQKPTTEDISTTKSVDTQSVVTDTVITINSESVTKISKPLPSPKKSKPLINKEPVAEPIESVASNPIVPAMVNRQPSLMIQWDSDTYNYNTIKSGQIVKHKYTFTNTGTEDIEVTGAFPDCGCTVPGYPFLPIGPGEKGQIDITYNSVGKEGPQHSKIKVRFQGYAEDVILHLRGVVLPGG